MTRQLLIALHDEELARHGGSMGIRDEGLLESALAAPQQLHHYKGVTDLPRLAAAYAVRLARNHPFVDGNKRTAFAAAGVFLDLNNLPFIGDKAVAVHAMLAVATGDMPEEEFAGWIAENVQKGE